MAQPGPLLRLVDVSKRFDSPAGESIAVLDEVSFELAPGEAMAIVGPSGSGKSTLLHIIGSLDRPTGGQVLLDGVDLACMDERQLATVRNRSLGFVFQSHYLLPHCTVLENVILPTLAPGPDQSESAQREPVETRAAALLSRLGLGERLEHRPGQLSGGERQRVAVARALINQPRLVLADEPTGALDQAAAAELARLFGQLNREQGVALVVVTHSLTLADAIGNVRRLQGGRLSPPQQASTHSA